MQRPTCRSRQQRLELALRFRRPPPCRLQRCGQLAHLATEGGEAVFGVEANPQAARIYAF